MRKVALIMVLGLLSVSVFCAFAPPASAGTVKGGGSNVLLPDVYKVSVTFNGFVAVDQTYSYSGYSFMNYRYYDTADESVFLAAFGSTTLSTVPDSSSVTSGLVSVYVFIYDDPSKFTVRTATSSIPLTSAMLHESGAKFYLHSGQPVKLTMTYPSSAQFGTGNYYSYDILAGTSDILVMMEGEHRLVSFSYYSPYNKEMTIFASFTIEYDDPPASVAGYGAVMLILGSVCIGIMLFLGRGQKIKD